MHNSNRIAQFFPQVEASGDANTKVRPLTTGQGYLSKKNRAAFEPTISFFADSDMENTCARTDAWPFSTQPKFDESRDYHLLLWSNLLASSSLAEAQRRTAYRAYVKALFERSNDITEQLVERDLQLIRAENDSTQWTVPPARLSYEGVRRNARSLVLFLTLTQGIYLATGVQLVHPFLAGILVFVGLGFYWMAVEMRKEIRSALSAAPDSTGAGMRDPGSLGLIAK